MKIINKALQHLHRAFYYSVAGLKAAWQYQLSFRIEIALTVIILMVATLIAKNISQYFGLVASWLFVLTIECINSAIETIVDRIGSEIHPLSKRAKDLGSAAVFLACVVAILVWVSVIVSNWFIS